jgi:hypothetical protein
MCIVIILYLIYLLSDNTSKKLGTVTEFTIKTLFYSLPSIWVFPHMATAICHLERELCGMKVPEQCYQNRVHANSSTILSVWWSSLRSAVTFCWDVWAITVIALNARFWNSAWSFVTLIFLACEFATLLIHGVYCACLSDFSARGATWRHFSRQVAQLFPRKFWQ